MKLTQLRDLLAIVEHGILRAASRHLEIAQPLLTRSVRALEDRSARRSSNAQRRA